MVLAWDCYINLWITVPYTSFPRALWLLLFILYHHNAFFFKSPQLTIQREYDVIHGFPPYNTNFSRSAKNRGDQQLTYWHSTWNIQNFSSQFGYCLKIFRGPCQMFVVLLLFILYHHNAFFFKSPQFTFQCEYDVIHGFNSFTSNILWCLYFSFLLFLHFRLFVFSFYFYLKA
jgi:hypothetical protein